MSKKTTKAIVGIVAAVIAGALGISTTQKIQISSNKLQPFLIPHRKLLK